MAKQAFRRGNATQTSIKKEGKLHCARKTADQREGPRLEWGEGHLERVLLSGYYIGENIGSTTASLWGSVEKLWLKVSSLRDAKKKNRPSAKN